MWQNYGGSEHEPKPPSERSPRNGGCRSGRFTLCAERSGAHADYLMGTLYKRAGSLNWMMAVTVDGRQVCKSTHTSNKRKADQLLSRWETEVFERQLLSADIFSSTLRGLGRRLSRKGDASEHPQAIWFFRQQTEDSHSLGREFQTSLPSALRTTKKRGCPRV